MTQPKIRNAALYSRVSTAEQHTENQLAELRQYASARGWPVAEFIDHGVSGAKESRPALDRLMTEARRRKFDAVIVWSLDRFGRSLAHVVTTINELHERGIAFVSLREGIDLATAAGRLQFHMLAALAEFERARIAERARAGQDRARREGKHIGRPRKDVPAAALDRTRGLSLREAARTLGVSRTSIHRARLAQKTPGIRADVSPDFSPETATAEATL